ncbi:MAG: glycosyl transferase family 1 [Rhodobacterales bacterium RIFCSPHIGHO2_02_FULL_62_130]|nr:MAG: glycosyl transferase family 1 [Rhodobacterales bacterium RIFCSPHIGHO2_02_FULL_62_130]OHC61026.1 MAG: glycosyl transferase family 1 [Rhodobacterales bacterium RIFCSPHIGHO2_12_FULL_62_75]HCY99126.1 glycosyl transferase family 1 [Rhodobacter sp.]
MKVLFIHQNFPGQFLHLAPELAKRGHQCLALTNAKNNRASAIPVLRYKHDTPEVDPAATRLGRNYTLMSDRGVSVARAARQLRDERGYTPDVIFGHSGWGETLFLKEVWPTAKLIVYAEFYYKGVGADVGFDPEFSTAGFDQVMIAQGRTAHLGQALLHADAGVSPTEWQASTYPAPLRRMISVIHDGVDTDALAPDPAARFALPDGRVLHAGDEVLTFVNRNLEPYRGYHIFMRALPAVLKARPEAQVVIVGGDEVSYGVAPKGEKGWKERILTEVRDQLDLSRVHFMGKVPYANFRALLHVSRVHAYLTYPFVLSWSMIEAMAAGCHIVASDTAPVTEAITDGQNGTLVNFFDVAAWSEKLTEALANPARFQPLRDAARQTALARYDLRRHCLPRMVDFVEGFAPR